MKEITLTLHDLYFWDDIEKFAKENNLFVRDEYNLLIPFSDTDTVGTIGEITMPLYFESGEVAVIGVNLSQNPY